MNTYIPKKREYLSWTAYSIALLAALYYLIKTDEKHSFWFKALIIFIVPMLVSTLFYRIGGLIGLESGYDEYIKSLDDSNQSLPK